MNLFKKSLIGFSVLSCLSNVNAGYSFEELDKATARVNKTHEERVSEFHQYLNSYLDEYELWRSEYNYNLDKQREELINVWGRGDVSDQTKTVEYSSDNKIKKITDYENGTATISVLIDSKGTSETANRIIKKQIFNIDGENINLSNASILLESVDYSRKQENIEKSFIINQVNLQMKDLDIQADRLIQSETGMPDSFILERANNKKVILLDDTKKRLTKIANTFSHKRLKLGIENVERPLKENKGVTQLSSNSDVSEQIERKSVVHKKEAENSTGPELDIAVKNGQEKRKIVSYTVKLPRKSFNKRVVQYKPLAESESKRWGIDQAVIMAIMHSESSFRADAKSHVPAFGLMQVVPVSAGHDVNKFIRQIDAPMKAEDLYSANLNVETGTAYLYILNNKYLSSISNDESRLYCTIAAYNTGAGNVARAFNKDRSTNVKKASKVINNMTPEQVYSHLLAQLPYDETKNYLKKVTERIFLYK